MATPTSQPPESSLSFVEFNPTKSETIVFLHGLFSSHAEWALVAPHLPSHHLLLVDLPGHTGSASITPSTFPAQVAAVARLITAHAHGGAAHVVGLSMGGGVAFELSRRHPALVRSAFVSGATVLEGASLWCVQHPSAIWYPTKFMMEWMPGFYRWSLARQGLSVPEELFADLRENMRWEVLCEACEGIASVGWGTLAEITVRTLVVAGAKGDPVEQIRKSGPVLRESGDERSRAVVVRKAAHAWDLQFPELFAQGVQAWVTEEPLPEEFEDMEL